SPFVGPSILVGRYVFDSARGDSRGTYSSGSQRFIRSGVAVDAGVQIATRIGFLIEVGGGFEYTTGSPGMGNPMGGWFSLTSEDAFYGSGLRPRILLS